MRFCPFPPSHPPLCSNFLSEEIEKSLRVFRLISTPVRDLYGGKKRRRVLRRVRIDQTLYNVVQWSWELQTPLPAMTRCQITIRTSLSAFKEIDFIFMEKKSSFDSWGVWWKKRRPLRNKVIEKRQERRRKNGRRRLVIRWKDER